MRLFQKVYLSLKTPQILKLILLLKIIIQGQINGNLSSNGRVELSPTDVFEGSIKTDSLVIQEGAKFNGTTSMNLNPVKAPSVGKVTKTQKNKDKNLEVGDIAVNDGMSTKAPEVKVNL